MLKPVCCPTTRFIVNEYSSLPAITVDDAECGDDSHTHEARQRHDDPPVRKAAADDGIEEQRLAGHVVVTMVSAHHLFIEVHNARDSLDKTRAVGQLCGTAHQEQPNEITCQYHSH